MSTEIETELRTIAARLVEERLRHGHTQATARLLAGASSTAWKQREAGAAELRAVELARLSQQGYDIYWILTGEHAGAQLDGDEAAILESIRALPDPARAMIIGALAGHAFPDRVAALLSGGAERPQRPAQRAEHVVQAGSPRRRSAAAKKASA